jgi:hypothetical protein
LLNSHSNNSNKESEKSQGNFDNPYSENIYDLSNTYDSPYTDSAANPNPKNYSNYKPKRTRVANRIRHREMSVKQTQMEL